MPCDRDIVRDLARRVAEIAASDVNLERRRLWLKHNSLKGERPMVLAETSGVWKEITDSWTPLQCADEKMRNLEFSLRMTIYEFEQVADDKVVSPYFNARWMIQVSNYGVQDQIHRADTGGTLGSYVWDAPIQDIRRDFHKLHPRTYSVDREATFAEKARMEELLGDILPVRIRGAFWWTMGLTWSAIRLIGLEPLMMFMYDDPEGLHQLMAFLRDDHIAFATWCQNEGLLTLNNENDYIGSGGHGYCDELPRADHAEGDPIRLCDLWMLSESQETVGVGPEQFAEFIFPYQKALTDLAGLVYYGCCEPVHSRWHVLKQIPNLRSVSISPWCDEEKMAADMGRKYVYARKPKPTLISTEHFDESAIRADVAHTLKVAKDCEVEFAMKDVHTLCGQPDRLGRWVQLAREQIDRAG